MSQKTLQERPDPINRKPTATLVFGIAGRIGSGASFVSNALIEELKAYGYTPVSIKVTEKFFETNDQEMSEEEGEDFFARTGLSYQEVPQEAKRIIKLQIKGDKMRSKFGENYFAAMSIDYISKHH